MRDAPRTFPVRAKPLGFSCTKARCLERGRHLAHTNTQSRELRSSLRRQLVWRWQGLSLADQRGPAHELVERSAQLPAEMPCNARSRDAKHDQCKESCCRD